MSEQNEENTEPVIPWPSLIAGFIMDKECRVDKVGNHMDSGDYYTIATPDISKYCKTCGHETAYHCESGYTQIPYNVASNQFLTYLCRNCQGNRVVYALRLLWNYKKAVVNEKPLTGNPPGGGTRRVTAGDLAAGVFTKGEDICMAIKLGEYPQTSPKLSKQVYKLLEKDEEFLKLAVKAEVYSMGIGAFAYYRRVVENSRTELFNQLIKAAQQMKADSSLIKALEEDRDNWRFSDSVSNLKAILPDRFNLGGHNPLALLHNALSDKLHNESDLVCLQTAAHIRVVLTHFASLLSSIINNEAELQEAVKALATKSKAKDEPHS